LGARATETNFKQLPLSQYNVIHLALHWYVDPEISDRSALVFAPENPAKDDGLLQVREIRNPVAMRRVGETATRIATCYFAFNIATIE
jgi:CHAT domain-containing protein